MRVGERGTGSETAWHLKLRREETPGGRLAAEAERLRWLSSRFGGAYATLALTGCGHASRGHRFPRRN